MIDNITLMPATTRLNIATATLATGENSFNSTRVGIIKIARDSLNIKE